MSVLNIYVTLVQEIDAILATDLDASVKCRSIQTLIRNAREGNVYLERDHDQPGTWLKVGPA
jgi:hypothetical protein